MGVDEAVDDGLAGRIDLVELNAHSDASIAPGDVAFRVDVAFQPRHAEPHLDRRSAFERACGTNGDAAVAQVERQGGGDRVAEPVLDGDPQDDAGAAPAVEVVRKQVRREGRQDVLDGAVLVHVPSHTERREVAHFVGAGDRAAEDQDREPTLVKLADGAHQFDAGTYPAYQFFFDK